MLGTLLSMEPPLHSLLPSPSAFAPHTTLLKKKILSGHRPVGGPRVQPRSYVNYYGGVRTTNLVQGGRSTDHALGCFDSVSLLWKYLNPYFSVLTLSYLNLCYWPITKSLSTGNSFWIDSNYFLSWQQFRPYFKQHYSRLKEIQETYPNVTCEPYLEPKSNKSTIKGPFGTQLGIFDYGVKYKMTPI